MKDHLVAAVAYDRLCTFEFGCVFEVFALPRPELDVDWAAFRQSLSLSNELEHETLGAVSSNFPSYTIGLKRPLFCRPKHQASLCGPIQAELEKVPQR
jgi:hypothetical protein